MRSFYIHPHAESDLDEIWEQDEDAAAEIEAVLGQIEADSCAIDKLTTQGDNWFDRWRLNVKQWLSAGYDVNLWRFRILDTPATSYRVFYGYQYQTRRICILAVAQKEEIDYDDRDNPLARRIFTDWRAALS